MTDAVEPLDEAGSSRELSSCSARLRRLAFRDASLDIAVHDMARRLDAIARSLLPNGLSDGEEIAFD